MQAHEVIARTLRANRVDVVFGIMGDSNMQFLAGFMEYGGRFVSSVHEGGATGMADGYSRGGDRVGVASVTHGPGTTNTLTALTEAVRARSALVVMTADTPPVRDDLQNSDLSAIAAAAGAEYWPVLSADRISTDLAAVLAKVVVTRRPIVLNIPAALLRTEVAEDIVVRRVIPATPAPTPESIDAVVAAISAARRPIVLAGRGAVLSGARAELLALAETIDAPVATTLLARDWFAGEAFDLGVFGGLSHREAMVVIAEADLILAFGTVLTPWTTHDERHLAGKTVVQVLTEPSLVGRYSVPDHVVLGDARRVAQELLARVLTRPAVQRSAELARSLTARHPRAEFAETHGEGVVDMRSAMIRLDELLPPTRNVITDSGRFKVAPWRYLRVADPLGFTHTTNFGSIGLGQSTAIGMAVARPDALTVCVAGDGGAMMNLLEFTTAVREGVPFVLVVLDDGSYGTEWTKLEGFGIDPRLSLTRWPDFVEMARSFGGDGLTVRSLADLDAVPELVANLARPLLIDVRADPAVDVGML